MVIGGKPVTDKSAVDDGADAPSLKTKVKADRRGGADPRGNADARSNADSRSNGDSR